MTRILRFISICVFAIAILFAYGCSKKDDGAAQTGQPPAQNEQAAAKEEPPAPVVEETKKLTVTYYNGSDVIKEETIEEGQSAPRYEPEIAGLTFLGWYAAPSMTREYDFSKQLTEDAKLFGAFANYKEDTRDWYVVGNGKSPLLLESAWGSVITGAHKLTKTGDNEYSITMDVQEGDEFQFAINSSWHNKRGFGYVKNAGDNFSGSGGMGASAKGMNIGCAISGNYTFTLKTYPADDIYLTGDSGYNEAEKEAFNEGKYDTITWVRNGDAAELGEVVTRFYIKGEKVTGWADVYDAATEMVKDGGKHTLTIALEAGDQFLFTSMVDVGGTVSVGSVYVKYENLDDAGKALFTDNGGNIAVTDGGTYTLVYDEASGVLSASK